MSIPKYDKNTIKGKIYSLSAYIFIGMFAITIFVLALLLMYSFQYSSVSGNITNASNFSQNFKNDVDLKMYYFVSGSSDELPFEEVRTARELALGLLENSKDGESCKALNNVINLCDNLENYIHKIENTDGYDNRMEQLDTNIYVITKLIEEHMYTYLYHEARVLAGIQSDLRRWLIIDFAAALFVMAVIAAIIMKFSFKLNKSINDPIDSISKRVDEIGKGDLTEKTPVLADDPMLSNLSTGVEEMVVKLNRQIELNRMEQERLSSIELSLVQAQINPHFLYNTLDAIVWLIETERNQEAEQMITSLSTYFRSFLSNGKVIISLAEEKQHVRSYLEIQSVRYKDILDYEIDIDESIDGCIIPKLTLQPMVENAIYHGIKPKRGRSRIRVTGRLNDGVVTLSVSDDGIGMDGETLEALRKRIVTDDYKSFGLIAAYKRLGMVYGSEYEFHIESQPNEGTTITIRIPYKTEEDEAIEEND